MIITRTPLRVSFCGGGTDFPAWFTGHGGAVVSVVIDKYCYISCRELPPFFEYKSRFVWSKIESVNALSQIEHPAIKGCLKFLRLDDPHLQVHHDGDLPAQSGTGSSASFTVGLLHALHSLRGNLVSKRLLAHEAIIVNQDVMEETVGCQDQVAAAFGGLNLIKFGPGKHDFTVEPLALSNNVYAKLSSHLMLFYTNHSRESSKIEQAKQGRNNDSILTQQAALVDQCVDALATGDMQVLGGLLSDSWVLKSNMAPEVSNRFLADCYGRAMLAGAYGCKVTGAGGGGCLLLVVPPNKQVAVKQALSDLVYIPFKFDYQGSQLIYYQPSGGRFNLADHTPPGTVVNI